MQRLLAALAIGIAFLVTQSRAEVPASLFYVRDGERMALEPSPRYFLVEQRAFVASMLPADSVSPADSELVAGHGLVLLRRNPGVSDRDFRHAAEPSIAAAGSGIALSRNGVDVLLVNEFIVRFSSAGHAARLLRSGRAEIVDQSAVVDHWYLVRFPDRGVLYGLDTANEWAHRNGVEYAYPNFVVINPRGRPVAAKPRRILQTAASSPPPTLTTTHERAPTPTPTRAPAPTPALTPTPTPTPQEATAAAVADSWPNDLWFALGYQKTGLELARAPEAWRITTGACNVNIAVLDDGVDMRHEDLEDRIVAAYDLIDGDDDPQPDADDGHGTAVAGIAAAATNNGRTGIAGATWNGGLIPLRVFESDSIAEFSQPAKIQAAIEKTLELSADVVNGSWGLTDEVLELDVYVGVEEVLKEAIEDGVVFVFAAGNGSGPTEWPARLAADMEVISVGSTDNFGVVMGSSKAGPSENSITLVAPGDEIVTTDISGAAGWSGNETGDGNYYFAFGDSSAAAAFVSGAAALLKSWHPDATPARIRDWLAAGAAEPATGDPDPAWGAGRLDMRRALEMAGTTSITLQPDRGQAVALRAGESVKLAVTVRRNGIPLSGATLRFEAGNPDLIAIEPTGQFLPTGCDGSAEVTVTALARGNQPIETFVTATVHTESLRIPVVLGNAQ